MPMWSGYWGGPWPGFGWIFPLLGLLFMVVMVVLCVRMMGRMGRGGGMPYGGHASGELEEFDAISGSCGRRSGNSARGNEEAAIWTGREWKRPRRAEWACRT